ncbi:hypothetical protein K3N28_10920 [Glycomyces sp. TRM65418]|uniref:hypothetical protein n=1 Tax=Glycomyces sp. TRM65418 TaxID=2867006 RepID=UPI001CE62DCC|nr:hypothetical protein [Glycomyces sp. TRM65418]MCC3763584.1 hypothetical protein [Glycomyces sp. TRM65418]QZD57567.1 hypothetical protein K3N28_10860 [Glycomyces sp. TRM65418]
MNGTHYLATAWIGERLLRFTAIPYQARLRITFGGIGTQPEALGSVIGLDTDAPGLRVSAPLHVEWATIHSASIIAEAVSIWNEVRRDCDG